MARDQRRLHLSLDTARAMADDGEHHTAVALALTVAELSNQEFPSIARAALQAASRWLDHLGFELLAQRALELASSTAVGDPPQ